MHFHELGLNLSNSVRYNSAHKFSYTPTIYNLDNKPEALKTKQKRGEKERSK
jgi:hypothetical protein